MKKRFMVIFAVIGIVALTGVAIAVGARSLTSKAGGNAIKAEITQAKVQEMVSSVNVTGNVKLKEPVRIYASNNGKIDKVLVTEGDYVKKGEILFTYNKDNTDDVINKLADARLNVRQIENELNLLNLPADQSEIKSIQAQITQYKTQLEEMDYTIKLDEESLHKAKSDYERAKDNYDKNKLMFEQGVIAKNEFDSFADALDTADLQVKNAENQLNKDRLSYSSVNAGLAAAEEKLNEQSNLADTQRVQNEIASKKIQLEQAQLNVKQLEDELAKYRDYEIAPFDGRVSAVNQNDGATVLEDTSVLEMVNENDTIIYLNIPEADMPDIVEGLDVILTGDGFNGEIKAAIKSIKFQAEKREINNASRNVVEAELELKGDESKKLRPGYTIDGEIIKKVDSSAVVIPLMSYLTDDSGKDFVYIVNDEDRLEKRIITLKDYSDMSISVEGIKEGERLLSAPDADNALLCEGALVSEITAEAETSDGSVAE